MPFFGREAEVNDLAQMLKDPLCRLMTLVGPGGMGKTRLAMQLAEQMAEFFSDGVQWVDLQSVSNVDYIIQAIADTLHLTLTHDPLLHIAKCLKSKNLLLVVDNFEHLIEGAPLLTALLADAPYLKMVVTSREALNLHEEWVHHLQGLRVPSAKNIENAEAYPSVELFITTARRASSDFVFEQEREAVVGICRHVAGMPLAIELAAAWTKTLTCTEIAAEIQRGLDLLSTRTRNVPERHRSMRMIFDQTCTMLTPEESSVFQRLSVFRGGFLKDAAEHVAGASLPVLTTLIDKSLVRHDSTGRYSMHELIRQYASEQLSQSPEMLETVTAQHAAYYMDFLNGQENQLRGGAQKQAIDQLKSELSNIHKAWRWAINSADSAAIQHGISAFVEFCEMQSRFREAADLLEKVAHRLKNITLTPQHERTLALLESYQARAYIRVGRLPEAEQIAHECHARYARLDIPPVPGFSTDPEFALGILALVYSNYTEALEYGHRVLQTSERFDHLFNQQLACYLIAEASIGLGDYENAKQYAQKNLSLLAEMDNQWSMAYSYNQLGRIARLQLDYETAKQNYQNSLNIREAFNDQEGMAQALYLMVEITLLNEGADAAREFFEKSLSIYRAIGDEGGLARILNSTAFAMITAQNYAAAQGLLREALEIAARLEFISVTFPLLLTIAELFIHAGERQRASDLLALVAHHPATSQEINVVLQRILKNHNVQLPSEHREHTDLNQVVTGLLSAFPWLTLKEEPVIIPKFKQDLIEPLTEREQEVLYHISQGLSNRRIAEEMVVSLSTVKSHINNLYGKLSVENRDDAVSRARDLGLL